MFGFAIIKVEADTIAVQEDIVAHFNDYMQTACHGAAASFVGTNEGYFRVSYNDSTGISSAGITAFGNFLQITGNVLKIPFNMWNVMEYNIGFWGGSGMAYSIFTSKWHVAKETPKKYENSLSLLLILLIIPLLVWKDAFQVSELMKCKFIDNQESTAWILALLTLTILVFVNVIVRLKIKGIQHFGPNDLMTLFLSMFGTYIIWSYLVTGIFMGVTRYEQPLYVINLLVFLLLFRKPVPPFSNDIWQENVPKDRWLLYFSLTITGIILLSLLTSLYGGFPNANLRFPL